MKWRQRIALITILVAGTAASVACGGAGEAPVADLGANIETISLHVEGMT